MNTVKKLSSFSMGENKVSTQFKKTFNFLGQNTSKLVHPALTFYQIRSVPKLSGEELAFYQACMQHSRPPDCRCPQYSGGEMPQLPPGKEGGWSRNEVDIEFALVNVY